MPIGIIINVLSVLIGGIMGSFCGSIIPERVRTSLSVIFGICSIGMGVLYISNMQSLPAVIMAIILGVSIGELVYLEKGLTKGIGAIKKPLAKIIKISGDEKEFLDEFIPIVVLFCASGTGIYGALETGMTGEHTTLIAKSVLDFFTAMTFAITLGNLVSLICIPQFIILILLYLSTSFLPTFTEIAISDFKACGGILMLATGFRISGIKNLPVANLIPSMILVIPLSNLWVNFIAPFISQLG